MIGFKLALHFDHVDHFGHNFHIGGFRKALLDTRAIVVGIAFNNLNTIARAKEITAHFFKILRVVHADQGQLVNNVAIGKNLTIPADLQMARTSRNVDDAASTLHLSSAQINGAHLQALAWADQVTDASA